MASKKNALHKLTTKSARTNLVVYLGASTNIDVLAHFYDTRSKTKALTKAQAHTLSVFNNSLYDTSPNSKVIAPPTTSSHGSRTSRQLFLKK